jgi:hypothetical protein
MLIHHQNYFVSGKLFFASYAKSSSLCARQCENLFVALRKMVDLNRGMAGPKSDLFPWPPEFVKGLGRGIIFPVGAGAYLQ